MRYFIDLAYKGTRYHGWQKQPNAVTIQEKLDEALQRIIRDDQIEVTGSGRTDAGVHATLQTAHFDTEVAFDPLKLRQVLNNYLSPDISILNIFQVREDAHARYDALRRSYEYHICLQKDPFRQELCCRYYREPDVDKMNEAALVLLKSEDFQSFSKVNTQVNHFLCRVEKACWVRQGDKLVFYIEANRFLRGMVRALVGTMLDVGCGKLSIRGFQEIIEARDRTRAGENAPAAGLYLTGVQYPDDIFTADGAN